jgi:hypothetical protein
MFSSSAGNNSRPQAVPKLSKPLEGRDSISPRALESGLILLRHNFSSAVSRRMRSATRASRQGFDDRVDQAHAHGCDRVRNMAFRPQGEILWVDNGRVSQPSGAAWCNEVLRGESSPSRRSGSRRLRCTSWRDDESRATRALRSGRARLPASVPDSPARYASAAWRSRRVRGS